MKDVGYEKVKRPELTGPLPLITNHGYKNKFVEKVSSRPDQDRRTLT